MSLGIQQVTVLIATVLLISRSSPATAEPQQRSNNVSIIIVGAGASGMAAATRLMANGFTNVRILEAEHRMGGRVHTTPFGVGVVDMGAQWCHGVADNVVYQMASQHDGLLSSNTARTDDTRLHRSDGHTIDDDVTERLRALASRIMHANGKRAMRDAGGSVGAYFAAAYAAALRTDERYADIEPAVAEQFAAYVSKFEGWDGAWYDWTEASALGFASYRDCDGDLLQNWRLNGYATVFRLLMNRMNGSRAAIIPADERIEFGRDVEQIVWPAAADADPAAPVQLFCSDGSRWTADHVIVSVSLGVLKERTPHGWFEPALPAAKLAAIEGLDLGSIDKFYVEFAEPFWPADWVGFSLLWTAGDLAALQPAEQWMQDVFAFYPIDFQPNLLAGWMLGAHAQTMEGLSHGELLGGAVRLLRRFLANMTVPEPVGVLRSRWHSNEHFRGSYSYRLMRADELETGPAALAEPVVRASGAPLLQFAGEATHEYYFSTVHGAIETGWREADRLIDWYGRVDV